MACGKPPEEGKKLLGCQKCKSRVKYCSRACQLAGWRLGHKESCGKRCLPTPSKVTYGSPAAVLPMLSEFHAAHGGLAKALRARAKGSRARSRRRHRPTRPTPLLDDLVPRAPPRRDLGRHRQGRRGHPPAARRRPAASRASFLLTIMSRPNNARVGAFPKERRKGHQERANFGRKRPRRRLGTGWLNDSRGRTRS